MNFVFFLSAFVFQAIFLEYLELLVLKKLLVRLCELRIHRLYTFTFVGLVAILDLPDAKEQPAIPWVHVVGVTGRGWPFGRPDSSG